MRAMAREHYGDADALRLVELPAPEPAADEVLIAVGAVAVSAGDVALLHGVPLVVRAAFGLRRPKQPVIGRDIAGEVVAVGAKVTRFAVGDAVFAESDQGGFAEFAVVPERFVAHRPANVDVVHAAAVPVSGVTALQGLRLAGLEGADAGSGRRVLVTGASGGVGGFAVQLAKAMGAHVTGVCRTEKAEHVRGLGADEVVDHTREDVTSSGRRYDVVFDLVADHSLGALRRVLEPRGVLVVASGSGGRVLGPLGRIAAASAISPFVSQRLAVLAARRDGDDLAELARRIDAGEVRPVVDRVFPLEQAAEAVRRFESGAVRGKLVLAVAP